MLSSIESLSAHLNGQQVHSFVSALFIFIMGLVLVYITKKYLYKILKNRFSKHQSMLIKRGIIYFILIIFSIIALQELGLDLNLLLGAAGILTIALGFASQTSVSNLISGLFLIMEKPFMIGDTIKVGDSTGEVLSIDILSVKIKTPENTLLRVPNETILKSQVINLTYFPVRRISFDFQIDQQEDISKVKDILFEVAEKNEFCAKIPKPIFTVEGLTDTGIKIQISVWTHNENIRQLKNSIQDEIKNALKKHKITMATTQPIIVVSNKTSDKKTK